MRMSSGFGVWCTSVTGKVTILSHLDFKDFKSEMATEPLQALILVGLWGNLLITQHPFHEGLTLGCFALQRQVDSLNWNIKIQPDQ